MMARKAVGSHFRGNDEGEAGIAVGEAAGQHFSFPMAEVLTG
jgi:hypothetical protein